MSTSDFPNQSFCYVMQLQANSKPTRTDNDSTKDGTNVVIHDDVKDSSQWFLWPVDAESTSASDWHYMFNRKSGTAAGIAKGSTSTGKNLQVDEFEAADYQQFKFTDTGKGYYVTARHSGLDLQTHNEKGDNQTTVEQGNEKDESHHRWTFGQLAAVPVPELQQGSDIDLATLVPQLTSLTETPPSESESVLIGEALTPFFMVDDPNLSPAEQVQQNPIYVLRREQLWTLVDKYFTDGGTAYTKEVTETFGYDNTTTNSISNTMGISVTADLGFSYSAISASVSATYSEQLQVTQSTSSTVSTMQQEKVKYSFDKGTAVNWALFQAIDRYTLLNIEGKVVYTWDIECDNVAQSTCTQPVGTDELNSAVEL